jgi:hypothetical protein
MKINNPSMGSAVVAEEIPDRDILPNASEDELAIEMMRSKVLRDCPECRLSDWPGVPTYGFRGKEEVRLGDIKHAVMDYCVLPLGTKLIHEVAPLVRSVCICGLPGSGQLFLARAICNELKVIELQREPLSGPYKPRQLELRSLFYSDRRQSSISRPRSTRAASRARGARTDSSRW